MKDESYSKIARYLSIVRRTVKRYAELQNYSPKITPRRKRKAPLMDPVKPIIDEHNFQGRYSSVNKYVKKAKQKLKLYDKSKTAIPLKHPGGEEQCDFG